MTDAGRTWFDIQTAGAPDVLRRRAQFYLDATNGSGLAATLADASRDALHEAAREGADRTAALDLLAADALITLALLAVAANDPAGLEHAAIALRREVASAP